MPSSGCNLPEELFYLVEKHVWARLEEDLLVVGLTDVAQHLAKSVISVSLKPAGKEIRAGRSLATVESGKWVGPVPSPVDGEVVEVNQALGTQPGLLNEDPYGRGWVAKVKPSDWSSSSEGMVTGSAGVAAYEQFLSDQGIACGGD